MRGIQERIHRIKYEALYNVWSGWEHNISGRRVFHGAATFYATGYRMSAAKPHKFLTSEFCGSEK